MSDTRRAEPTKPMTPASRKAWTRAKKEFARLERRKGKYYVQEKESEVSLAMHPKT
jgi:GrpB-like predicted nucleotidyltransferase (UPF0157 family)